MEQWRELIGCFREVGLEVCLLEDRNDLDHLKLRIRRIKRRGMGLQHGPCRTNCSEEREMRNGTDGRMEGGKTVRDLVVFRERDCVNAMGVLGPRLDVTF